MEHRESPDQTPDSRPIQEFQNEENRDQDVRNELVPIEPTAHTARKTFAPTFQSPKHRLLSGLLGARRLQTPRPKSLGGRQNTNVLWHIRAFRVRKVYVVTGIETDYHRYHLGALE